MFHFVVRRLTIPILNFIFHGSSRPIMTELRGHRKLAYGKGYPMPTFSRHHTSVLFQKFLIRSVYNDFVLKKTAEISSLGGGRKVAVVVFPTGKWIALVVILVLMK